VEFEDSGWFTYGDTIAFTHAEKSYFVKRYCLDRFGDSLALVRRILRECEILSFAKENSLSNFLQLDHISLDKHSQSIWIITRNFDANAQEHLQAIQISTTLTAQLIQGMCLGLKSLHDHNVLHRDLKLDSVMFNFSDSKEHMSEVVLIDFGHSTSIVGRAVLSTPLSRLEDSGVSVNAQKAHDLQSLHKIIKDVIPEGSNIHKLI
jgi:serine/threonine protein kinase